MIQTEDGHFGHGCFSQDVLARTFWPQMFRPDKDTREDILATDVLARMFWPGHFGHRCFGQIKIQGRTFWPRTF